MRALILNWIRYFLFRLFATAVLCLLALGCVYVASFAISLALIYFTHTTERPVWLPLVCFPAGALLFVGIIRLLGILDWTLRTGRSLKNDEPDA